MTRWTVDEADWWHSIAMTALTVKPFLPREAVASDLAAWCEVFSVGHRKLSGSFVEPSALAERLLAENAPAMRWAARSGSAGRVTGVAELRPQRHRPDIGFLRLFVAPPARRAGIGSALLRRVGLDASSAGVSRMQSTVLAGPPGEVFAHGVPALRVVLRLELQEQRLDNEAVLRRCHELAACTHPGYQLLHWRGRTPEPLVASFGRVMGHVLDAPGVALQMAPRAWDATAVRAWEAEMTTGGTRLLTCVAVHAVSGDVAAATVATIPSPGSPVADQHDTAVLPEHRRQGLARWIKARQADRLRACFPGVRAVTTTVNQENLPMMAVNRALGYRRAHERLLVEAPVTALRPPAASGGPGLRAGPAPGRAGTGR
jgi:GNAT superfamily N-acetyltransferase